MRRPILLLSALASLAASALTPLIPTAAAHEGTYPVVLVHGWTGQGSSWNSMIPKLQAQGMTVLDFDPNLAGTQAMSYAPSSGQHVPLLAKQVQGKIQTALANNGYPATQKVDIVAHSMGGLVSRFLVEKPGADVDSWTSTGWSGDGVADIRTDWASRVDDLIMLGTPNHGTWEAWVPGTIGAFGAWNASGGDMKPNSVFLQKMGYAEKAGEYYTAIGGDPAYGQFLRYDYTGDGVKHGFDGVVPAESPALTGADVSYVSSNHGELLTQDAPLDLVIGALGYTSTQTGGGTKRLTGTAKIRLEYAAIAADHDAGTTDENRFEVWVDKDGNNDGYTYLNTIAYDRDAPFTQNWGNAGPLSIAVTLPGTSAKVDVKLVAYEEDCCGAREAVSTTSFTDITLSDDLDGQDYYQRTSIDDEGGTNTFRVSLNGVTSDPT
ncbi:MAG: lipase class 2 [Frankiales bacterium]|nr:lipase class 2 [Frankiales bacterium]